MEFFKDPIIIQLSPIKHLAPSDPRKKLKRIIPYEKNKKQKVKEKDIMCQDSQNFSSLVYKSNNKKSKKENTKKNIKNIRKLDTDKENTFFLSSGIKNKDYMKLEKNTSFSLQESNGKNTDHAYLSNSTSSITKTLSLYEEFAWDSENNISYNISSDDCSLFSLTLDYDSDKVSSYKKLEGNSDDSWILF
ncbi:hypothetical protein PCK1_002363 [Pneumocystis canis]|nr:hypothetical protein PCK1_002363 [Pneumocystis canis]